MAEDAQSIRSLNWRELFPFINLFRAFRIAIHPSKLFLGFVLLLLVYSGGRFLDGVWPSRYYAVSNEIDAYTSYRWSHDQSRSFGNLRDELRAANAGEYADHLQTFGIVNDRGAALDAAHHGRYHAKLQQGIVQRRNDEIAKADQRYAATRKDIEDDKSLKEPERENLLRKAEQDHKAEVRQLEETTLVAVRALNAVTPRPLFDTFFDYEVRQFHNVTAGALSGNWLTGLTNSGEQTPDIAGRHSAPTGDANTGVLRAISNMTVTAPGWLLRYHCIFFILFAVWFLVIWAIFGGAIARIAAVHVARDEQISVRQALRFSFSKLLSFVFAPVIPLMIIVGAGAVIALGGLLMYIPVIGPILVGALFILALLAGVIITLVATGTVGGFNLMYPTIAVEGSDSFDAISRSFSYVFARPWRMLFYTVVSLVYGALCFIFVRYFVYVTLGVTHYFAQWFLGGQPAHYWPQIWPPVSDQDLAYRINFQALAWSEAIAAFFIAMWVYIVLTVLAAFVISFYFSANTIIYFLMRREVDATELDDVYVEEMEEEFTDPAPTVPAATMPASAVTPLSPGTGTPPPPAAEGGFAVPPA